MEDSRIWADSGTYEYSTRFSIFEARCLEQDFRRERVEERVTGARLSELFDEDVIFCFSIFLYFLFKTNISHIYHLILMKSIMLKDRKIIVSGLLYQ